MKSSKFEHSSKSRLPNFLIPFLFCGATTVTMQTLSIGKQLQSTLPLFFVNSGDSVAIQLPSLLPSQRGHQQPNRQRSSPVVSLSKVRTDKEAGWKMFPYLQVTVAGKLAAAAFDLYVTRRQHKRYAPEHPPSERVAAIIPKHKFVQAQAYCRAKSSFQILMNIIEATIETIVLLNYVAPRVWYFAGKYAQASELRQTLIFAVLFGAFGMLLDLPGSLYSTFVLEAKFGFNRTTPRTFVLDLAKEITLSAVLGLPMLSALYYVLDYFSTYSPVTIACGLWLLMSTFLITMMVIYPSFIAPMFNKFDPLPEGELKHKLVAMAHRLGFPLDKMYVIDGSRRSSHSNAYVFGLFKKYICIYDSLLEQTKGHDEQVVAVACHELGHWAHSHTVLGVLIALVQTFLTCLLYGVTAGNADLYKSFGYHDGMPLVIGLVLLNELLSPLDELLSPLGNMLSRRFEYQADAFAKGQGMAEELGKSLVSMSISNLSNMSPDPFYSTWNYSHPTLLERLDALNVTPRSEMEAPGSKKDD